MSPAPPRLGRAAAAVTVVAFIVYWIVAAEKPVAVHFTGLADEYLFLSQALDIVRGHWLGPYWTNTLVKGPGYPLFLAANHLLGLSVGLGQALLYFGAVVYCAFVTMRIFRTRAAFIATLIALLMIPIFYEPAMQHLLRDTFYAAIVLFYFAALFDVLFVPARRPRWVPAAACGAFAALLWITREEREWVVPAALFAAAVAVWQRRDRWKPLALELATAAACMAGVLAAIGLVNLAWYGRFILNEVKDGNFVAAMSAIQRASYEDFRPYLPVPRAARLRIYEASPTFARLRSFLDPPGGPSPWNYACQYDVYKDVCGDIAAGWFIWALREGAQRVGAHATPNTAAAFYRSIADEIEAACSQGKLRCGGRMPFFIPYMTAGQIASIPGHMMSALGIVAMLRPLDFSAAPSAFGSRKEEMLHLLNYPTHVVVNPDRTFVILGWYRRRGEEWFSVSGTGLREPLTLTRSESPDLVTHFADPLAHNQRFSLKATCSGECELTFRDRSGTTLTIAPSRATFPTWYHLGDGALYLDQLTSLSDTFRSPRAGLYAAWLATLRLARPLLCLIVSIGFLVSLAMFASAIRRREVTPALLVLSTLWIAVFARVALVALVEAAAFQAVNTSYLAPATPLAVLAGLVAILALADALTHPTDAFEPNSPRSGR